MKYRSSHVAKIFDISHETVRKWAEEFAEYLSPTATPGPNKQRQFSYEDMAVLSLVSEQKGQGLKFAEIHASLKAGQRGQPPSIEPNEVHNLVSSDHESFLSLQLQRMQHELLQAHESLKKAQLELEQMQSVKDENIKLSTQLTSLQSHFEDVQTRQERRIEDLMKRIEDISKEVGQQYSKGYLEALRERGDMPKREGE